MKRDAIPSEGKIDESIVALKHRTDIKIQHLKNYDKIRWFKIFWVKIASIAKFDDFAWERPSAEVVFVQMLKIEMRMPMWNE